MLCGRTAAPAVASYFPTLGFSLDPLSAVLIDPHNIDWWPNIVAARGNFRFDKAAHTVDQAVLPKPGRLFRQTIDRFRFAEESGYDVTLTIIQAVIRQNADAYLLRTELNRAEISNEDQGPPSFKAGNDNLEERSSAGEFLAK